MSDRRNPNAADTEQIRAAERRERREARELQEAYRQVLGLPAGRRVLWDIMYQARTGLSHATEELPHLTASVWDASARIHYNAGRQDLGHLVQGRIRRAAPRMLLVMLDEAMAREASNDQERAAAQTNGAATQEETQANG